jgi:hypothetical protein
LPIGHDRRIIAHTLALPPAPADSKH